MRDTLGRAAQTEPVSDSEYFMIPPLRELMGPSDTVRRIISQVNRVAASDFTVVILGETGTGKELVARAIHHASKRSKGPFVPVDCGAIPETLLESELFGHEKGAFTSADSRKMGKFQIAEGGTLLLDEISNMPMASQAKLLRVLQDRVLYPVGGTRPVTVDVRLLVATNADLESGVTEGTFRQDLFYRVKEFTIIIPPLRDRSEDIIYLANRFLDITNMELKKTVRGFSDAALDMLLSFAWPGNVRQLRSTIRRAVLLADDVIDQKHLEMETPLSDTNGSLADDGEVGAPPRHTTSLKEMARQAVEAVERKALSDALRRTGGNKARAARMLRIDYKTMQLKIKKYGLSTDPEDFYF